MHQDHGVIIREGVGIEEIITTDAAAGTCVSGARLSDGSEETADFIIVGIGIIPNTELAETAGLACDQGVLVDEYCRTSDPAVYAAGDCTRFQYRGELTGSKVSAMLLIRVKSLPPICLPVMAAKQWPMHRSRGSGPINST